MRQLFFLFDLTEGGQSEVSFRAETPALEGIQLEDKVVFTFSHQ